MPAQSAVFAHELAAGSDVAEVADDVMGRESLCRYGARPAFYPFGYREARSLARLRMLPNGDVSYVVKKVGRGRVKHRGMTPLEFLALAGWQG